MQITKPPLLSKSLTNILVHAVEAVPIGDCPIDELDLQWENIQDVQELKFILTQILNYPSTDLAQIHRDSNRLGVLDLHQNTQIVTKISLTDDDNLVYCNCCGFLLQKEQLSLSTNVRSISNLGLSTYLYFQTLINLLILMVVLVLVYGIFAFVTNVIASNNFEPTSASITSNLDVLVISLGSKQQNKTEENENFYLIQCWLGTVTIIIWGLIFVFIKYFQKDGELEVQGETISASDFSVVMHGVPTKITQQQLQHELDQYYEELKSHTKPAQIDVPLKIVKINKAKPFYLNEDEFSDQQLKDINKQFSEKVEMFAKWILQRKQSRIFSVPESERKMEYEIFKKLKQRKHKKYEQLTETFLTHMREKENQQPTTTVFVTLQNNHAKDLLLYFNGKSILNIIRGIFCCRNKEIFSITVDGQEKEIKVRKAPQPEDVIWINVGQSTFQKFIRKFITYSVTLIMLGGSFGIIYVLSIEQVKNLDNSLSGVISIAIVLINIIIMQVIRGLTGLEREFTQNQHQTSLGIKTVIAQLVNSILIPIIVGVYIKKNLYNINGLAQDVFLLGITNALIMPLLKVLQPIYYISRLGVWWFKKPQNKLLLDQQDLNNKYEQIPFEVGFEYIYIVNEYLFVCFFISLQPIVAVFGILGFILMYWAQKYTLFNRMRRPFPGTDLVNTTMYQLIYFGPIVFSLGNLTWSNLLADGIPQSALVPNLISLGFAVIIWILPYKVIFALLFEGTYPQLMSFQKNRIYLSSEYDRLNPSTSSQAIESHIEYIKEKRQSFKNSTKQQLLKIQEIFLLQTQKGHRQKEQLPFLSMLTGSAQLKENQKQQQNHHLSHFDKIFSSIKESKKMKPQNFKKTLYRPDQQVDKKKKMQFTQNWKVKNKNEAQQGISYDFFIRQNKKSQKEIKQSKMLSKKKVGIIEQDSMDSFAHSQTNPLVMFNKNVIKIDQNQNPIITESSS